MIRYNIPSSLDGEITELGAVIEKFKKGEIDKTSIKSKRVPFGVYEQRVRDTYMLRVRCPGGIITPDQLALTAVLAKAHGRPDIHLTTRQEVQIHDLRIDDLVPLMHKLAAVGLSSRGGGGNTVRNIIASVDSGVKKGEVFDVEPHLLFITNHLIADGLSWGLPRKLKIALSNDAADSSFATSQDLGFIAAVKNGRRGFRVYIAGGLGAKPAVGKLLYDFLPEEEVLELSVAVRNFFNKHGNRKNRYAARIRFLWDRKGEEEFRKLLDEERAAVKGTLPAFVLNDIEQISSPAFAPETVSDAAAFELWKKRYAVEQKQQKFYTVTIPVPLGDLSAETAEKLSSFAQSFGENTIRLTVEQNIQLRNIPEAYLGNVYSFVSKNFTASNPSIYGSVVACAGASTCQLGICLPRGAAASLLKKISALGTALDAGSVSVKISGCPNACGQHWVADLGFFGTSRRKGTYLYPAYFVVVGASRSSEGAVLAGKIGEVSARDLPSFTADVIADYAKSAQRENDFSAYLAAEGRSAIESLINGKYADIPDYDDDKNYYFDWGAAEQFSVANRGTGECSAGLFDFIERDQALVTDLRKKLSSASAAEKNDILSGIVLAASRMLLITRGIEAGDSATVFSSFKTHFIESGLVSNAFLPLLNETAAADEALVSSFADAVLALYDSMDDSLNFKTVQPVTAPAAVVQSASAVKDLRGVACPINFVKTKAELSKISKGDLLEIYLDDGEPIANVPGSVRSEGHEIVSQTKDGSAWKVLIRKG